MILFFLPFLISWFPFLSKSEIGCNVKVGNNNICLELFNFSLYPHHGGLQAMGLGIMGLGSFFFQNEMYRKKEREHIEKTRGIKWRFKSSD